MRKKLLALFFIAFVLGGTFSPFLGAEKVFADSQALNDVFPQDETWPGTRVLQSNLKLKGVATNSQGALLGIDLTLSGPQEEITPKDTNGNQILDAGDDPSCSSDCDNFGGWDSIFDNNVFSSGDNGIFLIIGTEKTSTIQAGYNNPSENIPSQSRIDFTVFDPNAPQDTNGNPDKFVSVNITKAINIGYYISTSYGLFHDENGQPVTIGNASLQNIQIPVGGLSPGQNYYAQIYLGEDNGSNSASSNIIEFQTLAVDAVGATDPLNYQNTSTGTFTESQQNALFGEILDCGWDNWTGCFLTLYYNTLYTFSHFLVGLVGGLFDFFVGFSLSSNLYDYDKVTFIGDGWRIVRDLSNIFFIFILLYAAIGLILKLHHFDAKGIIAKVIIIGLLVNFSLFFTRIVIDASNVLARVFYNEINIQTGAAVVGKTEEIGLKPQSLSAGLVQGVALEGMVSKKSYDILMKNGGVSMSAMFLIITIGIIVNLIFAWTLLTVSMYFVGRILGLWFAMIFAPLAFVTNIVPALGSKLPKVGWKDWVKNLTDLAIMAPIFVFFMFLIIAFLQSGFMSSMLQSGNTNVSTTEFLISIVLQFMLIIGLIKTAEATTKKLSGQFGESVAGVAGGIAKFAGGAALGLGAGALALGGRSVLGKFMGKADTAGARENATKTGMRGWMARRQLDIADAGKKGSFDLRQNTIASTLSQKAGLNLNTGTGIPGLGRFNTANTAGGLEGARTREQIRLERRAEKYGRVDKDASHNIEHTIEERKERIEAAENMVEQRQAELNLAKGTPRADVAERDLGAAKEALRQAKNGTGALAVLGATRADGKTVTADDVARGAKSTEGMGLKDLEKLLETNKKARAREFLAERQKKYADGNIIDEKRDALGNIIKFGHLDKAAAAASSSYMARNFLRETWRGMSGGAGMGAIVAGAFTGGIGLVGGAAIGAAVSGGLRGTLANYFAQTNSALSATEEAIHSAMATGKDAHAAHPPKDSYKGPAGDFFTKLFGAFKQNDHGGGGGNDDHGHDDHGSHGGH